jgi:uncharacterized oligopeptide transporter (OPT) family protein
VSDLVENVFGGGGTLLTSSIITSMIIAAVVALVMEVLRTLSKGKFPLSPLAIGLGVVVPADSTLMMFLGAGFFALMHMLYGKREQTLGNRLWVQCHEPICAGIVAGAALIGILDVVTKVFILPQVGLIAP